MNAPVDILLVGAGGAGGVRCKKLAAVGLRVVVLWAVAVALVAQPEGWYVRVSRLMEAAELARALLLDGPYPDRASPAVSALGLISNGLPRERYAIIAKWTEALARWRAGRNRPSPAPVRTAPMAGTAREPAIARRGSDHR